MNDFGVTVSEGPSALPPPPEKLEMKGTGLIQRLLDADLEHIEHLTIPPSEVANLLKKSTEENIHPDVKFRAAVFLSKSNAGAGYEDAELKVRGWQGSAAKVSIIFKQTFVPIGKGSAATVSRGDVHYYASDT